MIMRDPRMLARLGLALAIAGMALLVIGILGAAVHFHEPYLPWRNFVSELGCAGSTTWAWTFNVAVSVCGLLLFPFVVAFSRMLGNQPAAVGRWIGALTMGCAVGLGIFPMDDLLPHLVVALGFFSGWLLLVPVLTVAAWRRHGRGRPALLLAGLASEAIGVVFLVHVFAAVAGLQAAFAQAGPGPGGGPVLQGFHRPAVWDIAVLEWGLVASIVVWFAVAWRELRRSLEPQAPSSGPDL